MEKAGLLKTAEKAGLSLKKVEDLKLLSTAERCGTSTRRVLLGIVVCWRRVGLTGDER